MTTVFIAGSITIKSLDPAAQVRLMNIIELGHDVVVGDADGADAVIQRFLHESGALRVTVYCVGAKPRNNIGGWPTRKVITYHRPGTRAYFTAKDLEMAKDADVGLMIWDGKSTGTLSNVIELLALKRNSTVFINREKFFHKVVNVGDLENLIQRMDEASRSSADSKIGLLDRITSLRESVAQADTCRSASQAGDSVE